MKKTIIKGQDIIFNPINKHQYTLIWLHGLGDTAFGWSDIFEFQNPFPPTTKIFLPTAPTMKMDISPGFPVTGWYALKSMIRSSNIEEYLDIDTLKQSEKLVKSYIDEAIKEVGEQNVYIGGFSQGGMMATFCGLQYQQLKGIINLVAPLFPQQLVPINNYKNCRILSRVGLYDQVIPINYVRSSWKEIITQGNVDYKEYEMGHELIMDVLNDIKQWIKE